MLFFRTIPVGRVILQIELIVETTLFDRRMTFRSHRQIFLTANTSSSACVDSVGFYVNCDDWSTSVCYVISAFDWSDGGSV